MRRILISALAVAMCAGIVLALDGVGYSISVTTGQVYQTQDRINVNGKPVTASFTISPSGSSGTVSVASVSGYGSSVGAEKIVLAPFTLASGKNTNTVSDLYLFRDMLRLTVTNLWTNTITVKGIVVLE